MGKLKAAPDNFARVTIQGWGLPGSDAILDQIKEAVRLAAEEAIAFSLEEHIRFEFGEDRPLMAKVILALTDGESYDGPCWEIDLRREFTQLIKMYAGYDGLFTPDDMPMMLGIRDELANVVAEFDKALGNGDAVGER